MTEETAEVPQLDYSKPPPGFRISGPPSHSEHTQAAIRDAWAYYKTDNDPPYVGSFSPSRVATLRALWECRSG